MSDIETNLQTIINAVHGRDVRQAIHDAIHDCYEDGKAGSTDLVARERISEIVTDSTGSLSGYSVQTQTLTLSTLNQSGDKYNYTGSTTFTNDVTIIDVVAYSSGYGAGIPISYKYENRTLTATATVTFEFSAGVDATIVYLQSEPISLTELTDIRVGEDGTVYNTAGDAVRGQISDLKSEISDIEEQIEGGTGSGLTEEVKQALLAMFRKCMMFDGGDVAYDDLESALYPPANLVSITAVYTQSGTVYDTASLDDLKTDLVVTANMSDGTSETVTTYTLSGTLTEGTSTITVAYGGKTATFNVTVTHFDGIHIDVDVSKIILKKSNSGIAPTYCSTTANNRMSYPDFDLLIEGGKSYKFTVTSTVNTAQVGIQAFNQIALNAANNGNNFNATANTGEVWDSGWQSLESIVSIPASQNSSPIVGVRLAFRQSTSNPTISSNFVTAMTIEEVTE